MARAVSHANVCPVFELVHSGGVLAFTMARLHGETLAERLARGPVHRDETRRIARGLANGLDALYAAGVLHRDLKPSNIVLVNGVPVIVDFGLSAGMENAASGSQTQRHGFAGSPDYIWPRKQFRHGAATPAADIYAVGLILFEMVTGQRPFPAEDSIAAAIQRSLDEAPPVSHCGGAREWDTPVAWALGQPRPANKLLRSSYTNCRMT